MTGLPLSTVAIPSVGDVGERALVARILARLGRPSWLHVPAGDDAAVLEPEPRTLEVLTTDALVEGVHFDRRFCPPEAIGHKALAVNLSDLAAMGASPRAALLSLVLPDALPVADLDGILDGLLALAAQHGASLIGGNITRAGADGLGPLVLDVTAFGTVGKRRVLVRGGARAGDDVYMTGSVGAAGVGLASLREALAMTEGASDGGVADDEAAHGAASHEAASPSTALAETHAALTRARARYLRPEPRVRAGVMLGRNRAATACMDLSDGLADAVRQVAAASGVGITLDADALPIDAAVRQWHEVRGQDAVATAMSAGDDYELLFTARPSLQGRLRAVRRLLGDLPITKIGVVTRRQELRLQSPDGDRPFPSGYEHFA